MGKTGAPQRGRAGASGALMRVLRMLGRQREVTVFVIALALFLYFTIAKGSEFTSKSNQVTLWCDFTTPIIIIALGEVFLLICGEIDLSVGFVVGFAPFLMHYLIDFYSFPGLLAMFFALLFGVLVGWINGFFTVTIGVPSFITTLGTGFILLGLIDTTSHDEPAAIPASVEGIGKWIQYYAWAPIVWAVVLTVIFHIVLTRTRWGRGRPASTWAGSSTATS
jgi:simple sugar transport system permease protein